MDENRTPNPEQQNQAQQGYQQPQYQQPSYQTPNYQPPYYAPQPKLVNRGKGGGWIGFLRVMAWVMFAVIELAALVGGIMLMSTGHYWGVNWATIFSGLGIIVGGTLMAFIMIASINVALDMAMNTARTATNTAQLVEKVENLEKKIK